MIDQPDNACALFHNISPMNFLRKNDVVAEEDVAEEGAHAAGHGRGWDMSEGTRGLFGFDGFGSGLGGTSNSLQPARKLPHFEEWETRVCTSLVTGLVRHIRYTYLRGIGDAGLYPPICV